MIRAIVGVPGSGKSLALVERAIRALKEGRTVFANFPIKGCYEFSLDDLIDYAFPENSVVIIDEAGRLFNSRNWSNLPKEVFDLFTMHRHLNIDLYIGVQAFNRIDTSLREVIEITYVARKHWFRHSYRGFYEVARIGTLKGEEDIRYNIWFPWRLYKYYDTHAMKAVWQDKPFIPLRPYDALPPTKKERLIRFIVSIFRKIKSFVCRQKEIPIEEQEALLLEQQQNEEYESWLLEQDYLTQLEHKNKSQ